LRKEKKFGEKLLNLGLGTKGHFLKIQPGIKEKMRKGRRHPPKKLTK